MGIEIVWHAEYYRHVMFPVNKDLALWGMFEELLPTCALDASDVGVFNIFTATFARRFVYSAEPDFAVTLKAGTTGGRADFMGAITSEIKNNETDS